jgi:molybdenum cofactor cytidylyltransferase
MGSPKALLMYRGETFLGRLARLFAERCSPVIVVLGADAEAVCAVLVGQALSPARPVLNPQYRAGQTSSMQCGLRAVPPEAEGVLFTLVDHPAVAPATLDALLAPDRQPGRLVRVPRYAGRRGHPIWFSSSLIPEFLALEETGAARDVVRRHEPDTAFLDLDDSGIVADIDDPQAYRALTGGGA